MQNFSGLSGLEYTMHPGNENDSRIFRALYGKIKGFQPDMVVADAGYRTPTIALELIEDGVEALFPYKRPMTKQGFFPKYEYVYDEYYDCYICPGQVLGYHTTNRGGYKEYKSDGETCAGCPKLKKCTESRDHVKTVTRHVWEEYMEQAEEQHGFRYTQYIGKARMEMKAWLTYACMNLKKLARMLEVREKGRQPFSLKRFYLTFRIKINQTGSRKVVPEITSGTSFVYSLKSLQINL